MKFSKTALFVLTVILFVIAGCKSKPATEYPLDTRKVFGTNVTVTIFDPGHTQADLKPLFDDAFAFLTQWDKRAYSPGKENQVLHISTGAGQESVPADSDVFGMLMKGSRLYDASGQTFDIRYGPMIDAWGFGAKAHVPSSQQLDTMKAYVTDGGMFVAGNGILLAKPGMRFETRELVPGYAFDMLAARLAQKGIRSATIHSPYVWRTMGDPPDKRGFEVTFGSPISADSAWVHGWVPVGGIACASPSKDRFEAGGKAYHSILDPRTGMPAYKALGAIVQAADAATAAALAYGAFVHGTLDSLDASGKQMVGGSAMIQGSTDKPAVKASGSLANKIEVGK